jgi:O-antigen/teichoic acid export membrane protein
MSDLAWAALWLFPVVILGLELSGPAIGWFGASHRAAMALHTFVWWYFFNLLPSMARTVAQPRAELEGLMRRSLGITAWAGLGVALGFTLLAQQLLGLAYGGDFAQGGPLLAVIVWVIPVAAISGHYRNLMLAYDLQSLLFVWTAVAAVTACAITWGLAGELGAVSGSIGLVAGNLVLLALSWWTAAERICKIGFLRPMAAPSLAFVLALSPLLLDTGRWLQAAVAGAIYLVLFCWLRWDLASEALSRIARIGGRPAEAKDRVAQEASS